MQHAARAFHIDGFGSFTRCGYGACGLAAKPCFSSRLARPRTLSLRSLFLDERGSWHHGGMANDPLFLIDTRVGASRDERHYPLVVNFDPLDGASFPWGVTDSRRRKGHRKNTNLVLDFVLLSRGYWGGILFYLSCPSDFL